MSAGFVLDHDRYVGIRSQQTTPLADRDPSDTFYDLLQRYPTLASQFEREQPGMRRASENDVMGVVMGSPSPQLTHDTHATVQPVESRPSTDIARLTADAAVTAPRFPSVGDHSMTPAHGTSVDRASKSAFVDIAASMPLDSWFST